VSQTRFFVLYFVEMNLKKVDKEKIEKFVSMGMPQLLAAAYAKAIGGVVMMGLVDVNVKNGKIKYAPVPESKLSEAIEYIQQSGNNVILASAPIHYDTGGEELPKYFVLVQQEPDIRAFDLLLAHSVGRPTESIKVEQETKVLHLIAEAAIKNKEKNKNTPALSAPISSPFSPWKTTPNNEKPKTS
jgi:molybdopterin-biosynthesis enzyme MoeA-like protein